MGIEFLRQHQVGLVDSIFLISFCIANYKAEPFPPFQESFYTPVLCKAKQKIKILHLEGFFLSHFFSLLFLAVPVSARCTSL